MPVLSSEGKISAAVAAHTFSARALLALVDWATLLFAQLNTSVILSILVLLQPCWK